MKRESIPSDPELTLRFFSWSRCLSEITLRDGHGRQVFVEGFGEGWHYHSEIELTLFTEGEGMRFVGDDISHFHAPEMVLIGSNLPHFWQTERSAGLCIQFSIDPQSPLAALREIGSIRPLLDRANRGLLFDGDGLQQLIKQLVESSGESGLVRLSRVLEILSHLAGQPARSLSKLAMQPTENSHQFAIKSAVQYLIDHFGNESLQLDDVLQHIGLSRATFSRHFKAALGQSYTKFLQSIRLENARRLITTTHRPITNIAFDSGFGNLAHFNALFLQRWGLTPRDLRRNTTAISDRNVLRT